jgi:NAD+ kinase
MKGRVRRVAILGHTDRPGVRRAAAKLRTRLARRGCVVRLERTLAAQMNLEGTPLDELASWCQLLITLGGDGTVLAGGRALAGHRGALLAINFGGLGFLAAAEENELERAVRATVQRAGRTRATALAMNDAVVKGAGGTAAIHLQMEALGQDLGHLVADGLIAATAAGSTAYSLSAGGPVLAPDVEALVVTPVCAHSLGSRSLVLAGGDELALRLIGSFDRCQLLLDGHELTGLEPRDEIRIRLDRRAVRCVRNPERPFARSLQAKLGWQGSARRSM